jgi:hypothetical protein
VFIRAACLRPYQEGSHQSADFGKMHFDAEMPGSKNCISALTDRVCTLRRPTGHCHAASSGGCRSGKITLEVGAVGPHSFDNSGSNRACLARPACPRKLVERLATEEVGRRSVLVLHAYRLTGESSPKGVPCRVARIAPIGLERTPDIARPLRLKFRLACRGIPVTFHCGARIIEETVISSTFVSDRQLESLSI